MVDGGGTESYSTDTSSNRLLSVTSGSGTRSFTYDGAGNITADATGSTTYGLQRGPSPQLDRQPNPDRTGARLRSGMPDLRREQPGNSHSRWSSVGGRFRLRVA